jgi:hypothetical protein
VRKNAAFEVFAKGLAHIGLGSAVVALPIVLTRAGQLQSGLEMFGYCFAKQRALGVARVVEFGFGTRCGPARMRMRLRLRLRWACSGGHGAMPAWAGCLMILGLYPASLVLTLPCAVAIHS